SATGIATSTVAATSECQKKTSPRISSTGTPALIVMLDELEMNATAYTKSFVVRANVKMTTVSSPGRARGSTVLTTAPARLYPSTIACSSMSRGIERKKPTRSHVEKGAVSVGYTSTNAQIESCRPSSATIRERGRKRRVGGTR